MNCVPALRPYQASALERMRAAIDGGARSVLLVAPTGAGKTKIVSSLVAGARCDAVAHRTEIVRQIKGAFDSHGVVGRVCGVRSSLAPRYAHDRRSRYFFVDEAHHIAASSYQRLFRTVRGNRDKVLIGATATPYRADGASIGKYFDAVIETESAADLSRLGFLAPINYYAPIGVDFAGVKLSVRKDYDSKEAAERVRISVQAGDVTDAFTSYVGDRKSLVYCINQEHVEQTVRHLAAIGVSATAITSRTPHKEREEAIAAFDAGSVRALVNCEVLTEGTDLRNVGAMVMLRPTLSRSLYKQMLGRGMRPDADLVVVDLVGNFERHGDVMGEVGAVMMDRMGRVDTARTSHDPVVVKDAKERLHIESISDAAIRRVLIPSLFMEAIK